MSQKWNLGEKERKGLAKEPEKAILIGLITPKQTEDEIAEYLDELEFLAETAGAKTIKRFTQKLAHPEGRTFLGTGKLEEIRLYIETHEVDLVIFDDDLSPRQANNIEEVLKRKILDRSTLILDIFAARAQTAQAKTQVELAQIQYLLPRLRGMWSHLERQGGGIGTRGPGEQEIETDRRIVEKKIALLKEKLKEIDRQSYTQRKTRGEFIRVALVGYTNVGKSTLMNVLSKSEVFAENKLFATLDTTVRKVVLETTPFLLSDTVGFIRKLPHHLVESFKSTLDEVRESDLLLHVVDVSHPQFEDHIRVVTQTLQELGVEKQPVLFIFNKIDAYRKRSFDEYLGEDIKEELETEFKEGWIKRTEGNILFISATKQENIDKVRSKILEEVKKLYVIRYPYKTPFW